MNYLVVLVVSVVLLGVSAPAGLAANKVGAKSGSPKGEIPTAIATFQKEPSSPAGFAAGAKIMTFAKSSPTVKVSLSKAVVPWYKGQDEGEGDADTRHILLTAYVAGNISAQLKTGRPVNDVYAGWQQVLTTYAQLLRINSAAHISEVDDLQKREAAGTLRAYAASVSGER